MIPKNRTFRDTHNEGLSNFVARSALNRFFICLITHSDRFSGINALRSPNDEAEMKGWTDIDLSSDSGTTSKISYTCNRFWVRFKCDLKRQAITSEGFVACSLTGGIGRALAIVAFISSIYAWSTISSPTHDIGMPSRP